MINRFLFMITGLFIYLMRLFSKNNQLVVLNYHRILEAGERPFSIFDRLSPEEFENQIKILNVFFDIMPISEALIKLEKNTCPKNALAITFDDGYVECYEKVLPILKKYNLSACFFITTGGMLTGSTWETEIERCIETAYLHKLTINFLQKEYCLSSILQARNAAKEITQIFKYKTLAEREVLLIALKSKLGNTEKIFDYMTVAQVCLLHQEGMEIGAHSVNHPILAIEDMLTVKEEIIKSKETLEKLLGIKINLFAYPNGKFGSDFNQSTIDIVESCGFKFAFSSEWGCAKNLDYERYNINRIMPWDKDFNMFAIRVAFTILRSSYFGLKTHGK